MDEEQLTEIATVIEFGFKRLANSITDGGSAEGTDASGGKIQSLTEAVMGITAGLFSISRAIEDHANAIRESGGL